MTRLADNTGGVALLTESQAAPQQSAASPRLNRFLRQGFFSLADQAVASITNFATGVIIARASSKEQFGLYTLGFTLILLVTDLQTSLVATPYMVFAPRLKGRAQTFYTGSTLLQQVGLSLLGMLLIACGAIVTRFGIGPRGLGPVLWALAAVIGFIMLREFVRRLCFAALKLRSVFIFDTCIGGAQIAGLLILGRLGMLSARTAYWLIGPVCGIAVLWWMRVESRSYRVHWQRAVADMKSNWAFGRWVFASGLVWTASANLYPWLLALFHGAASAGVFAACMAVVSASNPALLGVQNFLGPKVAHEYAAKGQRALRHFVLKITLWMALPVTLLTLALMLWGDRFITLLYGSRYAGNGPVVAVLSINLLVSVVGFSFSRALLAMERANLDFVFNLAALFIMLTAGLWLVRTHGAMGAAIGLVTANLLTVLARAGIFLKFPVPTTDPQEAA